MINRMSLQSRKELTLQIRERYDKAAWKEKIKILDGFITATGYGRKHAISLLNSTDIAIKALPQAKKVSQSKYGIEVKEALTKVWLAANQICGKRLVPFLPELVKALESRGHLSLPADVRQRLLTISPATVDRLLKIKRQEVKRGISTTKPGSLLKKQIPIRTFADWNDVTPGFLEADLVAHCGTQTHGAFLNTLVLTDIASGWTEFISLLQRNETNVIVGLTTAQELLPFPWQGLDTDNGNEFINYKLLAFCEERKITFTRSRPYRKNDQAHVEEKNGSIVRRLIGYDRYEGEAAWYALCELYAVLRLYINFFQPSMKLIYKERHGAKVTKRYDKAQTPCQRLLSSLNISKEIKKDLQKQYDNLDPLKLLAELTRLQNQFWQYAWKESKPPFPDTHNLGEVSLPALNPCDSSLLPGQEVSSTRRYRRTPKPRKSSSPRTWRTRKDPFEEVWGKLIVDLQFNPQNTAKNLLLPLIEADPHHFNLKQERTLQRRIKEWRVSQSLYEKCIRSDGTLTPFLSLAQKAAK